MKKNQMEKYADEVVAFAMAAIRGEVPGFTTKDRAEIAVLFVDLLLRAP